MEYCWRWISHPDVRNSISRQIISRFMELAKGDDPAWNSFGLEFQDRVPIFEIMFFAVFFGTFPTFKKNQNQGASQTGYLLWYRHNKKSVFILKFGKKTFLIGQTPLNQILNTYPKELPTIQIWKTNKHFRFDLWPLVMSGPKFHGTDRSYPFLQNWPPFLRILIWKRQEATLHVHTRAN